LHNTRLRRLERLELICRMMHRLFHFLLKARRLSLDGPGLLPLRRNLYADLPFPNFATLTGLFLRRKH